MSRSTGLSTAPSRAGRSWWLLGLGVALLIAGVVSRFASSAPDGLERVAEDHGIAANAVEHHALLSYDGATALGGLCTRLSPPPPLGRGGGARGGG